MKLITVILTDLDKVWFFHNIQYSLFLKREEELDASNNNREERKEMQMALQT